MRIEIRPVPNRNRIREFSEGLEHFSQGHVLSPLVDPQTRRYATGLTDADREMLKGKGFPHDLDDTYTRGVPHPFWESGLVKTELRPGPTFLHPGKNDLDFIKWKFLKASSFVYASEEEMATGCKPQATHYIYDEREAMEIRATALQRRNALLSKLGKLSLQRKRDIVSLVLDEAVDTKGEDYLTVKLDEILQSEGQRKLLEDLMGRAGAEVALLSEVRTALRRNVLRRTKTGIFYFESNLGFGEAEVADFLAKPENQEVYLSIKGKI